MELTEDQINMIHEQLDCIDEDQVYDDFINDLYEPINICGYEYEPAHVLRQTDFIAYREGQNDYLDRLGVTEVSYCDSYLIYLTEEVEQLLESESE